MKQFIKVLILVGMALSYIVVAACSTTNYSSGEPQEIPSQILTGEYKIGVGDLIRVNVWKNPELSGDITVRPDGMISLPLIGDVSAVGVSSEALAADVGKQLGQYLRNPQVAVIVVTASSADFQLRVRVTGAVNAPLSIPYRKGMTVLDLVLQAGGTSEYASANKAKLYRRIDGEVLVYPVKLKDILDKGKLQTNYNLAPSDILTVPDRIL